MMDSPGKIEQGYNKDTPRTSFFGPARLVVIRCLPKKNFLNSCEGLRMGRAAQVNGKNSLQLILMMSRWKRLESWP